MRALIRREVPLAVPAAAAWEYVTDWPSQSDWVPHTRVEHVDPAAPARGVGGRIRAWSGLGRFGFWDTMTITSWEVRPDGGGRCEVLHTGTVVRGEGEFEVVADGPDASRFLWSELAVVPGGRLGALGWKVARPVVERLLDQGLAVLKERLEGGPEEAARA
jgi:polyketide cyclase/dehydrase/lipid transport protein